MTLAREQEDEIRAQFADVRHFATNRYADYYTVGADRGVTVTARHATGLYVCHTCITNACKHIERVEAYEKVFGTPETRARTEGQ